MRIAILAEDFPPNQGGIADYANNVVEQLLAAGHEVFVVAPHVSEDSVFDRQFCAPVSRVGRLDIRRQKLGLVKRMQAVCEMNSEVERWYDQAYSSTPPDFAIVMSVSVWAKLCIKKKIPYVVCVHGGDAFGSRSDLIRSYYRKKVVRKVLRSARLVVTNSNFTRAELDQFDVHHENVITAFCGVNEFFLDQVRNESIRRLEGDLTGRLFMICRLVNVKACDVVIKAVALLKDDYPLLRLTIAGDGPERAPLEMLVNKLGLSKRVTFVGYIDGIKDKVTLYKENDILVMSGRHDPVSGQKEAFGIVFLEAGACYRPVIGPRIGGVPDAIEEGVSGLLVEPDDVDSMAQAIRWLLVQSESASAMGVAGRQRVDETFNYKQISDRIVNAMLARL